MNRSFVVWSRNLLLYTLVLSILFFYNKSSWSQFLIIHIIDMTLGYLEGLKNYSIVFLCISLSGERLMWMWEEKNDLAKKFTRANSSRRNNFHKTVKLLVRELFVCFSDMSIACSFTWVATRFLACTVWFVCNR